MLFRTFVGLVFFFPLLYPQVFAATPPLSIFQGTLSEAQVAAKLADQPLLVYVYDAEASHARRMKRETWEDSEVRTLLHEHYVVFFQPISAADSTVQLDYPVHDLPTLLFVHPQGQLMGSVEGFVAPKSLGHMLRRYQRRVHPMQAAHYAVRRPTRQEVSFELTRPSAAAYELSVAGLETYSLEQLGLSRGDRPQLGLLAGSYQEMPQLQRAMRRMQRVWPGEMYVYAEIPSGLDPPVYKLILGAFDDHALAQRYADAMVRHAQVEVDLLDLTPLVAR